MVHERFARHHRLFRRTAARAVFLLLAIVFGRAQRAPEEAG
ncbi:hypothetical protein [Methanoculleus bourgensis]|jgi:hypothetical protein|nr:hypothetical protein [Methanoculleus bourgensis]